MPIDLDLEDNSNVSFIHTKLRPEFMKSYGSKLNPDAFILL